MKNEEIELLTDIWQALFGGVVNLLGTRTIGIVTESGQYDVYQPENRETFTPIVHFFMIYEFTAGGIRGSSENGLQTHLLRQVWEVS